MHPEAPTYCSAIIIDLHCVPLNKAKFGANLTEVLEWKGFRRRHWGLELVLDSQPTTSPGECGACKKGKDEIKNQGKTCEIKVNKKSRNQ